MNSRFIKWQLIACGCFSAILLAEWGMGEASRSQLQTLLDKNIPSDYQSEPMPTLAQSKQFGDSFNAIIERPLFIEGRKPLPEQAVEETESADNGQLDDWLLIGIYNKDNRKMALFRKRNEAKTFLKLNETQMITGWQLLQIQGDRVVLQQGGQQKSIMLRKPREQNPVPAASKRPVIPAKPKAPVVPINNNSPENINNDSETQ
jgi:hypothetical protein